MSEQIQEVAAEQQAVPMRAINTDLFNRLLKYLDSQPHTDVRSLIDTLTSAPVINVTFTPPGTN